MISPTYTDETVEKVARAICEVPGFYCVQSHGVVPFDHRSDYIQDLLREIARAALSVRPSTGSDAGDLVKRMENVAAYIRGEPCVGATAYPLTVPGRAMADLYSEAAASIAALSEENERLKAALGEVVNPDITKAGK